MIIDFILFVEFNVEGIWVKNILWNKRSLCQSLLNALPVFLIFLLFLWIFHTNTPSLKNRLHTLYKLFLCLIFGHACSLFPLVVEFPLNIIDYWWFLSLCVSMQILHEKSVEFDSHLPIIVLIYNKCRIGLSSVEVIVDTPESLVIRFYIRLTH